MSFYNYFFYLFAFLPSFIWLIFYLRKDLHPESKKMILRVFCGGAGIVLFILFLEITLNISLSFLESRKILTPLFFSLFIISFIEEYGKYLVVKLNVLKSSELDEPFDVLLYLVISALGFAALENILVLSNYHPFLIIKNILWLMFLRFFGAVFLHTLTSAIFGFFLAISFLHLQERKILFTCGLLTSSLLHTFYNFFIIQLTDWTKLVLTLILLITMASCVLLAIKKLKELKSICLFGKNLKKNWD